MKKKEGLNNTNHINNNNNNNRYWCNAEACFTFVGKAADTLFALDVPESHCLIV